MVVVNFILNVAGLLLWVNWILMRATPPTGRPTTLLGTLRPARPSSWRRGYVLATLLALLALRAWVYWEIAGTASWTPKLNLGVVYIAFRCDLFQRALMYSVLSFAVALAVFYVWLLLLCMLNRRPPNPDPFGRFVRITLGPLARLSAWVQLVLPPAVGVAFWLLLSEVLVRMNLLPRPDSFVQRIEQGLLIGLGACLTWCHLLAGVLLLHVVNSYVHLGDHPLWAYVSSLARTFLTPFRRLPLQVGKVDLAPVAALSLVYLVARGGAHLLLVLYRSLPL